MLAKKAHRVCTFSLIREHPTVSTHCCMLPCPRKGFGEEIGKVGGSTWDAKQERNAER